MIRTNSILLFDLHYFVGYVKVITYTPVTGALCIQNKTIIPRLEKEVCEKGSCTKFFSMETNFAKVIYLTYPGYDILQDVGYNVQKYQLVRAYCVISESQISHFHL